MSLNRPASPLQRVPLLALALSACITAIGDVRVLPLNDPGYALPPRQAANVRVFTGNDKPTQPFVEVASLLGGPCGGRIAGDMGSLEDVQARLAKLRQRAGELGCDGLLVAGDVWSATCIAFR
jgi:hypothetical protein